MLYQLSLCINPDTVHTKVHKFAFLAASLHTISPAGLFLSAPYSESPFSFFNFAGFFLYARSHQRRSSGRDGIGNLLLVSSGIVFCLASTFRGNGLLSGLTYCYEAIDCAVALLQQKEVGANLRRLCAVVLTGSLMASGPIILQYLAYRNYCVDIERFEDRRPWCSKWIPSIYAWVQEFYW